MTRASRISRRAFTLTEILVVIAIIAVLASLTTAAVIAVVGRQKVNNTTNTIKVVNAVLQKHWQYVIDEAKQDIANGLVSPAVTNMAQPDSTGERAQVLWIKFRLMEAFPQSYAEIGTAAAPPWFYQADPFGNGPYIPPAQQKNIAAYQKNLASPPYVAASNSATTQSAACLLMALSVNRKGVMLTQDQIGFAVADTDGDGVKELVDAWTKPLVFVRFDTSAGVQAVNPAASGGKNATFADPIDQDGTLINAPWYSSPNAYVAPNNARLFYESKVLLSPNAIETAPGSGTANYVIPSITSTGGGTPIISYNLR